MIFFLYNLYYTRNNVSADKQYESNLIRAVFSGLTSLSLYRETAAILDPPAGRS